MHEEDELYPKTRAAEQHANDEPDRFAPYLVVALAVAVLCVLVAWLTVELSDAPARGAADHAAVVDAEPTATPGPPVYRGGALAGQQSDPTLAGLTCGQEPTR